MNTGALTRILTLALIAAFVLPAVAHAFPCDGMMCAPGTLARSRTATPLDACDFAICTFILISVSALGMILSMLPGRLSESTLFVRAVNLPLLVPPPRSA